MGVAAMLLPKSVWWGRSPLDMIDIWLMRFISFNGICSMLLPFTAYHYGDCGKKDPRYQFPCTLSHSIRRPGLARRLYQAGYILFVLAMTALSIRRKAPRMARTLALLVAGALHIAVAVPEPHEVLAQPTRSKAREILHFGGAALCVLGLGYGFSHPESTRASFKTWYFGDKRCAT